MAAVTESLDGYEPFPAATAIAELIDDASNWYVRRSRRRFWRTDPDADPADSLGAQATLHEVLVTVARLLAPMRPFLADRMWRDLTGAADDDSVHLADWPEADPALVDPALEAGMALARRLSSLGRAARSEAGREGPPAAGPGPRLPAARQSRSRRRASWRTSSTWTVVEVTDELGDVLAYELVPNFKLLGPRLGKRVQDLRSAMAIGGRRGRGRRPGRGSPGGGGARTTDPSNSSGEEVELRVRAQPGFAVSRDGAEVRGPRPGPRRRPPAPRAWPVR